MASAAPTGIETDTRSRQAEQGNRPCSDGCKTQPHCSPIEEVGAAGTLGGAESRREQVGPVQGACSLTGWSC